MCPLPVLGPLQEPVACSRGCSSSTSQASKLRARTAASRPRRTAKVRAQIGGHPQPSIPARGPGEETSWLQEGLSGARWKGCCSPARAPGRLCGGSSWGGSEDALPVPQPVLGGSQEGVRECWMPLQAGPHDPPPSLSASVKSTPHFILCSYMGPCPSVPILYPFLPVSAPRLSSCTSVRPLGPSLCPSDLLPFPFPVLLPSLTPH